MLIALNNKLTCTGGLIDVDVHRESTTREVKGRGVTSSHKLNLTDPCRIVPCRYHCWGMPGQRLGHLLQYMRKYNAESPKQGNKRFNYIVKTINIANLGMIYLCWCWCLNKVLFTCSTGHHQYQMDTGRRSKPKVYILVHMDNKKSPFTVQLVFIRVGWNIMFSLIVVVTLFRVENMISSFKSLLIL